MSRNAVRDDTRIGDFTLSSEIGKGSFAVVHKGYRQQTNEPVAIKIVTRKKLTVKLLDNLEGEIAILKAITHPNIVELKECLKTDAHIYLVMAFCSAGDLSQYIKKRYDIHALNEQGGGNDSSSGSKTAVTTREPSRYPHPDDGGLNETIVRSILTQLAGALQFMRGRDIVHRDIKPQNLLLQPPEQAFVDLGNPREIPQVKVADFGFARHLGSNVLAETLCGSPLYMAPEILRYEKYDAKADLWSVGAVLFEMSVGKPPYKANNHVELLRRIEKGEDKFKFPDERSAGSLAREAARRQEAGEAPLPPPHSVSADIKILIRQLLRQRPVERMSFDDFFRSPVIEDYKIEVQANVPRKNGPNAAGLTEVEAHTAFVKGAAAATDSAGLQRKGSRSQESHGSSSARPRDLLSQGSWQNEPAAPGGGGGSPRPAPASVPRSFSSRYIVGDDPPQPAASSSSTRPSERRPSDTRQEPSRTDSTSSPSREAVALPAAAGAAAATRRYSSTAVTGLGQGSSESDPPQQRPQQAYSESLESEAAASLDQGSGEDSFLGKEYVMVEKRNVEVNALADELAASPLPPQSGMARRPSRLSRLSSGVTAAAVAAATNIGGGGGGGPAGGDSSVTTRFSSTPPGGVWPSSAPFALPPGARPSSFPRRTSLSSSGSPSPRLTTQPMPTIESNGGSTSIATGSGGTASSNTVARRDSSGISIAEEPTVGSRPIYSASPSSGSPSSALARAISMASLRLFGVPSGMSLRGAAALVRSRSNRRTSYLRSGEPAGDGAEAGLLVTLEDLGQKSFVLSEFADSKLAAFFPTGPHQSTQNLDSSSMMQHGVGGSSPGRAYSYGGGGGDTGGVSSSSRANRRTSSASSISSAFDASAAETAAAEALVLYVKSLSFLQRGINATKVFLEARSRPNAPAAPSAELNEIVQWLRARFNEGYDKADFARSKCGEIPESAQHVDRLIFDKALEVARAAALDELENNHQVEGSAWDANHCLLAYETANSMLRALLDPGEEGMGLSDGSIGTIEKFVKSINKRLVALQGKLGGGSSGSAVNHTSSPAGVAAAGVAAGGDNPAAAGSPSQ